MDQQALNLLNTLKRPAAPSEAKVNLLNALKSDIKHYRVPEAAQATIFECIKLAITQQVSAALASSAFSTLGHLVKRLKIQDASGAAIVQLAPRLFAPLHDRLGDAREPVRQAAAQALCDLYSFCTADVEQIVRDEAIGGSNARAKEAGMRWVVKMHKDEGMPFKGYVAAIVARLEDADGSVREAAKAVLIELFVDAPDRAKTDLKRQLKAHSVRHSIESQILAQIGPTASARAPALTNAEPELEQEVARPPRSRPIVDHTAHFVDSINSEAAQPPPPETVPMDPIYVHSQRELEDVFRDILPHFEGKEDEHNWMPRDKSILKVRRLLKGNAPNEFHHAFMVGVKSLVDGMIKAANSLRTTMSTNGCQLVQELARTLGPALDPHVEILLQSFIKMSAATKHIAAENGKATSDAIFQNCSYNVRMMQHIWFAIQEKNVQQRQCVPDWLRTILKRQASYKSHFEGSGGLDLAEKCIRKGLDDANPKVKEGMRATYWTFARSWPDKADGIISKLDPKSRATLEKDPNNPNAVLHGPVPSLAPPARTGGASSRNTLRELMAEQRKAKAAGKLPDRPSSAMAELSPAKSKSHSSLRAASRAPSNLSTVQRSEARDNAAGNPPSFADPVNTSAAKKGSSLMSGPMRRPRRAEIQRPQTADPYASRRMLRPETPANSSPANSPPKGSGASKSSIPTSSAVRSRARADHGLRSPASSSSARRSPMLTNGHHLPDSRPTSKGSATNNTASADEEHDDGHATPMPLSRAAFTRGRTAAGLSPGHQRGGLTQTMSVDNGLVAAMADDEGFTMVMPDLHHHRDQHQLPRSPPPPYRSPMKAMFDDARERAGKLSPEAQRAMEHAGQSSPEYEAVALSNGDNNDQKMEDVQIFQDPFTDDSAAISSARDARKVLGELAVNENVRLTSPTQSVASNVSPANSPQQGSNGTVAATANGARSHSRDIDHSNDNNTNAINAVTDPPIPSSSVLTSEQDRAELLRNRRLLASGIERIRTRSLDAHGFRRVQDLAKCPLDIFTTAAPGGGGESQYDALMAVLLDYIQSFTRDAKLAALPPTKAAGLQTQALGAVRALLAVRRKEAGAWHARVLVAILLCRRDVEGSGVPSSSSPSAFSAHVLADLQRTVEDVVLVAAPTTCIDAVVAHLAAPTDATPPSSPRATAMALDVLRRLLVAAAARGLELGGERKRSVARIAARFLADADAEVRKADVDLSSELFEAFGAKDDGAGGAGGKESFWKEFRGVEEGRLGLLTYYIAKRSKSAGATKAG